MIPAKKENALARTSLDLLRSNQQFIRYLAVGLFNTGVTALVIFIMTRLEYSYYLTNIIGYIIGLIVSFFLNAHFTFKTKDNVARMSKFIMVFIISYLVNLVVITLLKQVIPDYPFISQLIGMPFYTITGYLLNKHWVFR